MLLPNRAPVIENIKKNLASGQQNAKVELGDPELTPAESLEVVAAYRRYKQTFRYRMKSWLANAAINLLSRHLNRGMEIVGLEKLATLKTGAIITSNHFNPVDSTVTRLLALRRKKRKLAIVSQATNLKMTGLFGFVMTNLNIIALTQDRQYLEHDFPEQIGQELANGNFVLIYPEQEMWFNYRRPRQPKRGAYLYAAQLQAPIVSCFTEIIDCPEMESADFHKQRYRLHILDVLVPDDSLSVLENSRALCQRDFDLKRAAYEQIYGKDWAAPFDKTDIAGWIGDE